MLFKIFAAVHLDWYCPLLKQLDPPEEEELSTALQSVEAELGKLGEIVWLYHILQPNDEEVSERTTTQTTFTLLR